MNDDSQLVHFKHYTENVPELKNATSKIDIITKALKTPIFASNQLNVYVGCAALADHKSNKLAATSRRKSFTTESRYEAFETEGAYGVFPDSVDACVIFETSGTNDIDDDVPRNEVNYDYCEVYFTADLLQNGDTSSCSSIGRCLTHFHRQTGPFCTNSLRVQRRPSLSLGSLRRTMLSDPRKDPDRPPLVPPVNAGLIFQPPIPTHPKTLSVIFTPRMMLITCRPATPKSSSVTC